MEFADIINTQYAFHGIFVGCVLALALLVFIFGFKSAEEPPFDKLTNAHEDRKGTGKKKKLKDKKNQSNGHATAVTENTGTSGTNSGTKRSGDVKSLKKEQTVDKSPAKEQKKQEKKSPSKAALKETKQNKEEKGKKSGGNNTERKARGKENVEVKNKKNKVVEEKPKDFDDGEWEQALSKRDKKNRKTALEEILPQKSDKKKEKKKAKEESEVKDEVITAPEVTEEIVEIKQKINAKSEPKTVVTSIEPITEETKPKKTKKKKQNTESTAAVVVEKQPAVTENVIPPPKGQRQKKVQPDETSTTSPTQQPTPAPEPEKIETHVPPAESNVVFDELGDTWIEAKVPKKNQKKKSRKD